MPWWSQILIFWNCFHHQKIIIFNRLREVNNGTLFTGLKTILLRCLSYLPFISQSPGVRYEGRAGWDGASAPYSLTPDSTSRHFVSLLQNFFLFFLNISFGCLKNKIRKILSEDGLFCLMYFLYK